RAYDALTAVTAVKPLLYCSSFDVVDAERNKIRAKRTNLRPSKYNAPVENIVTGCTMALNSSARKLLISAKPMDYMMHDWWAYLVIAFFGEIICDQTPTLDYRQHGGNVVGGPSGPLSDFLRRTKRFFNRERSGVFGISMQAREFLRCF